MTQLIAALIAAACAAINIPGAMDGNPTSMALVVFLSAAAGANLMWAVNMVFRG